MKGPLILVSKQTRIVDYRNPEYGCAFPRQDIVEICQRIGGEIEGTRDGSMFASLIAGIESRLKVDFFTALRTSLEVSRYNAFLSASEKSAIPISAYLTILGNNLPHVVIGHRLNSDNKTRLFRIWPLHKSFSQLILVSKRQAEYATSVLGLPEDRVHFVFDKVDQKFFTPLTNECDNFILSVGNEQRDYELLLRAIEGTGIKLVVVAASPWSTNKVDGIRGQNVSFLSGISFLELRNLYDRARIVVVPLQSVDYAAGANTILEAMAMAKPLILGRSSGILEYIEDGQTGVFYSPGELDDLREKILSVWSQTRLQRRLGENARQAVLAQMNIDIYIDRVAEIVGRAVESYDRFY